MRLAGVLILALALAAPVASAQAVLAPEPARPASIPAALGANEMLFEVQVTGRSRSPADQVLITLTLQANGPTAAAARAAGEAMADRLRTVARGFGAEPAAASPRGYPGLAMTDGLTLFGPHGASEEGPATSVFTVTGGLRLRLGDPGRFAALRTALEEAGATTIVGPFYLLNDDSDARRAARLDAMAKARDEAERFARAQNMRVVRLVRFSEVSDQMAAMREWMAQFAGGAVGPGREVETSIGVEAGFALAPQ